MKNIIKAGFTLVLLTFSVISQADNYRLFVGQMKTLSLPNIDRVAVGNGGLVSTSIMDNGDLLILGEKAGDTEVQVWLKDGKVVAHKFYIIPANTARNVAEVRSIIGKVSGLSVRQVGSNIILKGTISQSAIAMLEKVSAVYTNVINLTSVASSTDLAKVLKEFPNIKVRDSGDKVIISGDVTEEDKSFIETIKSSYPKLVDLTIQGGEPMVYMKVQITELSNKVSEKLGVNWTVNTNQETFNYSTLGNLSNSVTGGLTGTLSAAISAAVEDNQALILASPTLSAQSGSEANFFSGGSFPIQFVVDGEVTTEFKDYGLSLKINPVIESNGTITTAIETELSDVDYSVAVGGIPGLLSRRTDTQVSLQPGQTFAISGLVDRSVSKGNSGLPFLSKIPIFGALFRSKDFSDDNSSLVIFITPYLVTPQGEINQKQLKLAESMKVKMLDISEFNMEIIE